MGVKRMQMIQKLTVAQSQEMSEKRETDGRRRGRLVGVEGEGEAEGEGSAEGHKDAEEQRGTAHREMDG